MAISGAKVVPKWDVHRLAEAGFQSGSNLEGERNIRGPWVHVFDTQSEQYWVRTHIPQKNKSPVPWAAVYLLLLRRAFVTSFLVSIPVLKLARLRVALMTSYAPPNHVDVRHLKGHLR